MSKTQGAATKAKQPKVTKTKATPLAVAELRKGRAKYFEYTGKVPAKELRGQYGILVRNVIAAMKEPKTKVQMADAYEAQDKRTKQTGKKVFDYYYARLRADGYLKETVRH